MRKLAAMALVGLSTCTFSPLWAAPGEYWEITNKMEMQGMAMPGMTHKVCMAKGSEKDPRNSADKDCEMTDMKSSGNKSSWKMRCVKDGEVMTGSGEMSASADRTEGTINFNSAKTGSMTMSFVNKRVGGACDTDEMKKKIDAMQDASNKQAAQQQALLCDGYKRNLGHDIGSYFQLKANGGAIAKSCAFDMDAVKKTLCKSVDANNADFGKQIRGDSGFYRKNLQAECPREMKTYMEVSRKRYCEGRAFTEKQRLSLADCLKGGSADDEAMNRADPEEPPMPSGNESTQQGGKAAPAKPDQGNAIKLPGGITLPGLPGGGNSVPADSLIEGAKKLKNLFGL